MIDYIYYERDIEGHPRTQQFFLRFPKARKIPCNHYKEVFNPNGQSFRLQKKKPALILAKQNGKKIHSIPPSYGIGGRQNFYFSHLLNCLYDCRYCFLQGMFPSAHYVLFVNYEDFWEDILTQVKQTDHEPSWFFRAMIVIASEWNLSLNLLNSFFHFLPNTPRHALNCVLKV